MTPCASCTCTIKSVVVVSVFAQSRCVFVHWVLDAWRSCAGQSVQIKHCELGQQSPDLKKSPRRVDVQLWQNELLGLLCPQISRTMCSACSVFCREPADSPGPALLPGPRRRARHRLSSRCECARLETQFRGVSTSPSPPPHCPPTPSFALQALCVSNFHLTFEVCPERLGIVGKVEEIPCLRPQRTNPFRLHFADLSLSVPAEDALHQDGPQLHPGILLQDARGL